MDKIRKIFEILGNLCESSDTCRYCPFHQDLNDEETHCKFELAVGYSPLVFIGEIIPEEENNDAEMTKDKLDNTMPYEGYYHLKDCFYGEI